MLSHLVKAVPTLERIYHFLFSGLRIFEVIIKVSNTTILSASQYTSEKYDFLFYNIYCSKCLINKAHGLN